MQNLLVIDNDTNNIIDLINYISTNCNQLKLYSIVPEITEGIEILNKGVVDLTIIKVSENIEDIISNLHMINNIYEEKYKKSIILLVEDSKYMIQNKYIYKNILYNEKNEVIYVEINNIVKNRCLKISELDLVNKINNELKYIGYNLSFYGTKYLAESIKIIYENGEEYENLNKTIYPVIAQKYHKTVNNIKCNIISATNSMFYECDEVKLKEYFSFYTIVKPKPKLVIYTILNKLYKNDKKI